MDKKEETIDVGPEMTPRQADTMHRIDEINAKLREARKAFNASMLEVQRAETRVTKHNLDAQGAKLHMAELQAELAKNWEDFDSRWDDDEATQAEEE